MFYTLTTILSGIHGCMTRHNIIRERKKGEFFLVHRRVYVMYWVGVSCGRFKREIMMMTRCSMYDSHACFAIWRYKILDWNGVKMSVKDICCIRIHVTYMTRGAAAKK